MDREYGRSVRTVYKENGKIGGHRSSFHRCEMMKRRSKLEIYLDVLKAVSETGRLTHIGNLANLSWNDTVKHLEFLELK